MGGQITLEYLVNNADKLKELSNIFLGFLMSIAFLVTIGVIIFFGYRVVREFKAALKEMSNSFAEARRESTEAMKSSQRETTEVMRELKDAVNGVRILVAEFKGDINANSSIVIQTREAIVMHDGHFNAHDERSHSIKEITSEAYDVMQGMRREMITKDDCKCIQSGIAEVNKSVNSLEKSVSVAMASIKGV